MLSRLKKLIRWARITKSGADDKQFPVQQVEYLGKVGDCMMVFPYGMHGNASVDSLVLMFGVGADSANRAGIPGTPGERPKMASDEFCLYHPKTKSIIHFKNDSSVEVTAPEMVLNGNLTVTGDLEVGGDTALGSIVTSNGKNIGETHLHAGSPTSPVGLITPTGILV